MNPTIRSLRRASLTAGLALTAMSLLAAFGVFGATKPLLTAGDAATTAAAILGSQSLFRAGVAALVLVVVLDVVVAAALLTLFTPVNRGIAVMAAWFRVAYAAVYLVAILQLVLALDLLDEPALAMRAIHAYETIWLVGLILFGVHLLLLGYLAYASGFMAKVFGILLVVAGLGYVVDGFAAVLVARPVVSIGSFTFVGEVVLIFWLLIVGRRGSFGRGDADQGPVLEPAADLLGTPTERRPVNVR